MQWQKNREYGRRNYSELGAQRYQRTFGDTMHARDFSRQQQEAMIASGALNKMTSLGMPQIHRSPKFCERRHREVLRNNALIIYIFSKISNGYCELG